MVLQKRIQLERLKLLQQSAELEKKIREAPEGSIRFHRDRDNYKWYQWFPDKRVYIPKKNRELAEALAVKRMNQARLYDVKNEIKALDAYCRIHREDDSSKEFLAPGHCMRELLLPSLDDKSEKLLKWAEEDYEKNPKHPELKTFMCKNGEKVRSKSEAYILTMLLDNGTPVRYECLIVINGIKLYPDFTIMNPINGEIYIWEHFGLIDDEKYRKNAEQKLELYMRAGFYPMVNLIITTETADHPLDYGLVCDLIDHYFVSR